MLYNKINCKKKAQYLSSLFGRINALKGKKKLEFTNELPYTIDFTKYQPAHRFTERKRTVHELKPIIQDMAKQQDHKTRRLLLC